MEKIKLLKFVVVSMLALFLMAPAICVGWDDGMEILANVDFSTIRHEWYPAVEYNAKNNEFWSYGIPAGNFQRIVQMAFTIPKVIVTAGTASMLKGSRRKVSSKVDQWNWFHLSLGLRLLPRLFITLKVTII